MNERDHHGGITHPHKRLISRIINTPRKINSEDNPCLDQPLVLFDLKVSWDKNEVEATEKRAK